MFFESRLISFLRDIKGEIPEDTRLSDRKDQTKAERVLSYDMALMGLINFIFEDLRNPDSFPVSEALGTV